MKKKIIYVVIAIAVVAVLAIGFQIFPKTLTFDFESNPISSAFFTYDEDPADSYERTHYTPNQAQINELESRLTSLSGARKVKEISEAHTIASIGIILDNGESLNFQGKDDGTLQLICRPSEEVYHINDKEFHRYLINVCSGGDRASATEVE